MRRLLPALVATVGVFAAPASAQQPARPGSGAPRAQKQEEELVDKVRDSIRNGVKYLKKQQSPQGTWEGIVLNVFADMEGGSTALVTLALLNCGEKPDDPAVAKALDYLRRLAPRKTYVVGLQNMVFAEVRQPKDLPIIQRNADWLLDSAIGLKAGKLDGWSYPGNTIADNSNTQYALLGLYAAKQAGARIGDDSWKAIQAYYTRTQRGSGPAGGYWTYTNTNFGDSGASFTMTVAGVCGLYIAGMGLNQSEQNLDPRTGVAANCGVYGENPAVAKGVNWIAQNFNFEQGKSHFYNVYGIERLGRLSGQRFVGRHDWYREGCEWVIRTQGPDGDFSKGRGIDGANVINSAFALLFLSKGRTPVLLSKFAWGDFQERPGDAFVEVGGPAEGVVNWNRKHNDTRHLVEFASRELFKGVPLAWQAYDVRRKTFPTEEDVLAEVGTLLQSPVVYLNGHGAIRLTDIQKKILQKYVEEGGFLLAEACCGDPAFAKSFRELMKELFPANDLRRLPETHAVWTSHFTDKGLSQFAELEGLEKGCRTVVVFSPVPLAGFWEEAKYMPAGKGPGGDRGQMTYKLAANIIAYATGLELPKPRLSRQQVFNGAAESGIPRSFFKAAQLKLTGDAEPAPAAMRNLMGHLRQTVRLEVVLDKVSLYPGATELFKYKFMYLHGRAVLNLNEADLENLQSNLQTGGLLFADAGCNGMTRWREFDKSFRETMKKLFTDKELTPIPPDDPLFSGKLTGGVPLAQVKCRREKPDGSGPEAEMRSYAPFLEGIKVDGRWVVIYSKYDVGCALEGHKSSDCLGHDKESALRIGSAVVLYALKR